MNWALPRSITMLACVAVCVTGQNFTTFQGMCDASGAVWLGKTLLVINDEDPGPTLLRAYDPASPDKSVRTIEVPQGPLLLDPAEQEIDLEGITWSGETLWLIGSHSRS